eukprot:5340362-Amphidinium_carterae.2
MQTQRLYFATQTVQRDCFNRSHSHMLSMCCTKLFDMEVAASWTISEVWHMMLNVSDASYPLAS